MILRFHETHWGRSASTAGEISTAPITIIAAARLDARVAGANALVGPALSAQIEERYATRGSIGSRFGAEDDDRLFIE
jgi:hypothetical protein